MWSECCDEGLYANYSKRDAELTRKLYEQARREELSKDTEIVGE